MSSWVCVATPEKHLVYTNHIYCCPTDTALLKRKATKDKPIADNFCIIGFSAAAGSSSSRPQIAFTVVPHPNIQPNQLALSSLMREMLGVSLGDQLKVTSFTPSTDGSFSLLSVQMELELIKVKFATLSEQLVTEFIKERIVNQILTRDQYFALDIGGTPVKLTVRALETPIPSDSSSSSSSSSSNSGSITRFSDRGLLLKDTIVEIRPIGESKNFKFEKSKQAGRPKIFDPNWNFGDMGIGGLDAQFNILFRRAFASRLFPSKVVKTELGINPVKGLLLYGPPGTGKTLIARQIGKMLTTREPKIVNGPEILNKFVGASEENIRKLFIDAEMDQKQNGENSDLHIIIFDEIDAITKARGRAGDSTGVGDTVVNQLLTKIDGVDSLHNILVIGMTNRRDLIDPALLRPGRFEVQIEITLPDEAGRLQIFNIHTKSMKASGRLAADVDLADLAARTKNFSGAEIEGLVRSAASFALYQSIDVTKGDDIRNQKQLDFQVTRDHFEMALSEVIPAFGVDEDEIKRLCRGELYDYGPEFQAVRSTIGNFVSAVRTNHGLELDALLLTGPSGSGKTSIAMRAALESKFEFVKVITTHQFQGLAETKKINDMIKIFEDSYKSPYSLIVMDSIEELIDYVPIGPRFSASVLQTIKALVTRPPPTEKHKLVIIATTSSPEVLQELGLREAFTVVDVDSLHTPDQVRRVIELMKIEVKGGRKELELMCLECPFPIPIKKLVAVIRSMNLDEPVSAKEFAQALSMRGLTKDKDYAKFYSSK